jgi:hypothetical protein
VPPIPAAAEEDVAPEAPSAQPIAFEAPAEEPMPLPTFATIGDADFALTPPAETEAESPVAEAPAEPPVAAEPEPELFDPARAMPEPAAEPFRLEPARALAEINPSPRILIDDTSFDPAETFDATYVEAAKPFNLKGVIPLLALGLLGLVFFGAGLFWGFSTGGRGGLSDPMTLLGWGLGIVGIGCFGVSAYLMLNRLVGEDDE